VVYTPAVLRSAVVTFEDTKRGISGKSTVFLVNPIDVAGNKVIWDRSVNAAPHADTSALGVEPLAGASFAALPPAALKSATWTAIRNDFENWVYANHRMQVLHSPLLDAWSNPGESADVFRARIAHTARELRDRALDELRERTAKRARMLQEREARSQVKVQTQKSQAQTATLSSAFDIGAGILGAVLGRKRGLATVLKGSNINKAGRVHREAGEAAAAGAELKRIRGDISELEAEVTAATEEIRAKYDTSALELETVTLAPLKKNIDVVAAGILWIPGESRA
jgi:hypothetical protein